MVADSKFTASADKAAPEGKPDLVRFYEGGFSYSDVGNGKVKEGKLDYNKDLEGGKVSYYPDGRIVTAFADGRTAIINPKAGTVTKKAAPSEDAEAKPAAGEAEPATPGMAQALGGSMSSLGPIMMFMLPILSMIFGGLGMGGGMDFGKMLGMGNKPAGDEHTQEVAEEDAEVAQKATVSAPAANAPAPG